MSDDTTTPIRQFLTELAVRAHTVDSATGPPALPVGVGFVDARRAELETAFDQFERVGQARLSGVCRHVMGSPACSFDPISQWGVCAMTGRTVNAMLRVHVSAELDIDVDAKFAPFLLSLWHFAHMQVIEETRLAEHTLETGEAWDAARANDFYADADEDGIGVAFAYAASLQVVLRVIATTMRTLESSQSGPAARDS